MFIRKSKYLPSLWIFVAFFLLQQQRIFAQDCTPQTRVYANSQTSSNNVVVPIVNVILAEVKNKPNAVDGTVNTYSTIATYVGLLGLGTAWQNLKFPAAELPAGNNGTTPISVKLGTGSSLLSVLGNVTLQATLNGTPVGTAYTGSSLLGLLGGQGENLVTFTPGAQYDGVRLFINPIVDVGTSVDLFYAYFNKASGSIACTTPIEVLSGSTGTLASALTAVDNPTKAIDGNLTEFAKLNAAASALNESYLTVMYPAAAVIGDSIRVLIESDNLTLLNASVLAANFHVRAFSNQTQVMDVAGNSPLLNLNLLNGSSTKYTITIPITAAFNKLQIAAGGGLVSLLSGLRIYEVQRIIAKPKISSTALVGNLISLCAGNTATLTVGTAQDCTTYNWYNTSVGGSILQSGTTYTPAVGILAEGDHIFYVEAVRTNCTETSGRIAVNVKVNPLPTLTLGTDPSICIETPNALLPFTNTTANPTTYSITWSGATLTNIVDATFPAGSNISIPIANGIPAATYSGTITLKNANGCTSSAKNFNVVVNPKSPPPNLAITTN